MDRFLFCLTITRFTLLFDLVLLVAVGAGESSLQNFVPLIVFLVLKYVSEITVL